MITSCIYLFLFLFITSFFYNCVLPVSYLHYNSILGFTLLLVVFVGTLIASLLDFYPEATAVIGSYALILVPVSFSFFSTSEIIFLWDIYSVLFLGLTLVIFFLVIYYSGNSIFTKIRAYYILLYTLFFLLLIAFSVVNLFFFYVVFETLLLPMFFLIGVWGSRERRVRAAMFFFMYTAIFSMFLLFALLLIWDWFGSYDYFMLKYFFFSPYFFLSSSKTHLLWILLFLAFTAKLPVIPFHLWLPEAHVEAPTTGSVILASILLKLGGYGLIRFLLPFFFSSHIFFLSLTFVIAVISVIYATFMAIVQVDLKKIIAYSSIVHMNLGLLGLFSLSVYGVLGSIFLFLGHGFISAALFFLVGSLYSRTNTRLLKYYSGFTVFGPNLSFFFLFFSFANIGFPGTINFVSEFLIFYSVSLGSNFFIFLIIAPSFVASLFYSVWIYNKIFHGTLNTNYVLYFYDVEYYEKIILYSLLSLTIFFGIFPFFIIDFFNSLFIWL